MNDPIIVTGVPRSGTSMTCGSLHAIGAFGGKMRGPNSNNKKGMFENYRLVDLFKNYLISIGADPRAQKPLPLVTNLKEWPTLQTEVLDIMRSEGLRDGMPWFFKTVKGCHFWPVIHKAFPNATWVIIRRPMHANADSLLRTPFMTAYNTIPDWETYIINHRFRFMEIENTVKSCFTVHTQDLVNGDFSIIETIASQTGLTYDADKVAEFVEPSLFKVIP